MKETTLPGPCSAHTLSQRRASGKAKLIERCSDGVQGAEEALWGQEKTIIGSRLPCERLSFQRGIFLTSTGVSLTVEDIFTGGDVCWDATQVTVDGMPAPFSPLVYSVKPRTTCPAYSRPNTLGECIDVPGGGGHRTILINVSIVLGGMLILAAALGYLYWRRKTVCQPPTRGAFWNPSHRFACELGTAFQ